MPAIKIMIYAPFNIYLGNCHPSARTLAVVISHIIKTFYKQKSIPVFTRNAFK